MSGVEVEDRAPRRATDRAPATRRARRRPAWAHRAPRSTSAPASPPTGSSCSSSASSAATGYVINLIVFALLTQALDVHHIAAAIGAFCVAVTNNFLLNRHWTFDAAEGHAGFQAARFFTVSLVALGVNLVVLELLVDGARARRAAGAGDRRRARDAGQLHRQQAVDVRRD